MDGRPEDTVSVDDVVELEDAWWVAESIDLKSKLDW